MSIARNIYYFLPPTLRFWSRRMLYLPYDLYNSVIKRNKKIIPPRGMIFVGSGDFIEQGEHLLQLVIKYTNLKPDHKILDIGCGIGRLAVPLTTYLDGNGLYEGFDVVKLGIDWCNKKIARNYSNFHFKWVNLKNDLYNLSTTNQANKFKFPYPDNYFDSIVLTSVFTHMLPNDVKHYLEEISKVINDEGKCLATFFLINKEVKRQMQNKETGFLFKYSFNGYSLMNIKVKEANVAYEESFLFSIIQECDLKIESIHRGRWSNGSDPLDFQDVIILRK